MGTDQKHRDLQLLITWLMSVQPSSNVAFYFVYLIFFVSLFPFIVLYTTNWYLTNGALKINKSFGTGHVRGKRSEAKGNHGLVLRTHSPPAGAAAGLPRLATTVQGLKVQRSVMQAAPPHPGQWHPEARMGGCLHGSVVSWRGATMGGWDEPRAVWREGGLASFLRGSEI